MASPPQQEGRNRDARATPLVKPGATTMRTKVTEIDLLETRTLPELSGFEAAEVLFRKGRDPLGTARIMCTDAMQSREALVNRFSSLPTEKRRPVATDSLPTVSVAVCTRDRSDDLARLLPSIRDQDLVPHEVLVVENGSTGAVEPFVRRHLPDATYLREERVGLDFARNRALWAATGDVLAFLDDDTVADAGWVRAVAEGFAGVPEVGALTGLILPLELETRGQRLFEANGGFGRGFRRRVLPGEEKRLLGLRVPLAAVVIGAGSGCNMALRTGLFRELGGFDEALDTGRPLPGGGDLDALYRVMHAGHHLVYEPRAIVRHRHRQSDAELVTQLTGHHRSFTAFLVKLLLREPGIARVENALFLIWRLSKNGLRLIRRVVGRDPLPATVLARMFASSVVGLGSYHASLRRTARDRSLRADLR